MKFRTAEELLAAGRNALPAVLADHIAAGAGDESTVAANRAALGRVGLVPSVATGVGQASSATDLLGVPLAVPVLTAPMGPVELIDPGGAVSVARGAAAAGIATIAALTSAPVLEEVAKVECPLLFQLYWWGNRDWISRMIERIEAAGAAAVVITVDAPAYGTRRRDMENSFDHHGQMVMPNLAGAPAERAERLAHQAAFHWDDLEWLCSRTRLPTVVKGILSARDARSAVEVGAAAIYVSNHGGRALAGQVGTADALEDVAEAIGAMVPIIVDGGFRTAEDVAKGLALGATAVALGRPVAWALAAGGADGVGEFVNLIGEDLRTALTILGARTPVALSHRHVRAI